MGERENIQTGIPMRVAFSWSSLVYNRLHVVGEHSGEEGEQEVASSKVTMGASEVMMCAPGRADV